MQRQLDQSAELALEELPVACDVGTKKNSRGKDIIPMAPHETARYKERTAVERFNSRLKEEFRANNVMVRGAVKVKAHLMFGVIAIFADQLTKLVTRSH